MANGTPPAGICELMRALQNSDNAIRSEAEKKLMEAVKGAPDQLVLELLAVLGASNESASVELRQEAVVVLRQCAMEHNSKSCWKSLQNTTKEALKEQILVSLTKDPSLPVRRNAANVVSTVASTCANSYSELVKEWPRLLLFLSETISSGQAPQVTACLKVLTELVDLIGEELLKQGPQTVALLQTCLQSPPGEVRAAAVQLLFQMVEDLEEEVLTPLGPLMPQTIEVIKGFAMASEHEDCLKETLEALISSAEEEPEFFKAHGLQQLWPLLLEMCKADHWADSAVRHSAMEAVMSFFEGLCEDFCKPEGLPFLEQLLTLNIQWMLEVEKIRRRQELGLCPVPFGDIVAAPNQIAMAKIDPVALFAKDFKVFRKVVQECPKEFERMIERRREHMEKRTENQLVTMMFNIDRSDPDRTDGFPEVHKSMSCDFSRETTAESRVECRLRMVDQSVLSL